MVLFLLLLDRGGKYFIWTLCPIWTDWENLSRSLQLLVQQLGSDVNFFLFQIQVGTRSNYLDKSGPRAWFFWVQVQSQAFWVGPAGYLKQLTFFKHVSLCICVKKVNTKNSTLPCSIATLFLSYKVAHLGISSTTRKLDFLSLWHLSHLSRPTFMICEICVVPSSPKQCFYFISLHGNLGCCLSLSWWNLMMLILIILCSDFGDAWSIHIWELGGRTFTLIIWNPFKGFIFFNLVNSWALLEVLMWVICCIFFCLIFTWRYKLICCRCFYPSICLCFQFHWD